MQLPSSLNFRLPHFRPGAKTAAIWLFAVGLAVYATGLSSPFMGDDNDQIISNTMVHSLGHIGNLFGGGTFFEGSGKTQLTGFYYRPLMTTAYAVIYTAFGPHPFTFHLFQLIVFILGALLVFLVLREFLRPGWALAAALIFLVHPLGSQAVFSIPTLQDPLYFTFGLLGFWLLLRFPSRRVLLAAIVCLFLSLLSKETGVVFMALCFVYLVMFDRKRLALFTAGAIPAFAVYLALKIHAVGLAKPSHIAPIDDLSLPSRLANIPALIVHYFGLAILPLRLASTYYWSYPVSLAHFWLPLLLVLGLVFAGLYAGYELHRRTSRRVFTTYLFFVVWVILGLLPHLQLIPLDMTACDTWFYASMVGLLGALALLGQTYFRRVNPQWLLAALAVAVVLLGVRTALRGLDWHSGASLAQADLKASPGNFVAQYQLALNLRKQGDFRDAETLALHSVQTFPTGSNWDVLGKVLMSEAKYAQAKQAFEAGIKRQPLYTLYQDEAALSVASGDPTITVQMLTDWSKTYPTNASIWAALAVADYRAGNAGQAKSAITTAHRLNPANRTITDIYNQLSRGGQLVLH